MLHKQRWTAEKIEQRIDLIEGLVYRRRRPLPPFRYTKLDGPMDPAPVAADIDDSAWPEVRAYSYWGEWLANYALRGSFTVPSDWDAAAPVSLYLPLGEAGDFDHPEALVYIDGTPYSGADRQHHEIALKPAHRDGKTHRLVLHGWMGGIYRGHEHTQPYIKECAVVQVDQPTRDLVALSRVALGIARGLDSLEPAKGRLLNALDAAFKQIDLREPFGDDFYASVPGALAALRTGVAEAGAPLDVGIVASGHAHIDVAWLWTLGQTRRKTERTFSTALRLMEEFPAYHFTQSQPQLYDYIRQDQPEVFEQIKERVAEGRWEPIGGMWVEADCNLSGAESLARQFLLGRTFFREHFGEGVESPVLWLPDVFGYAWALPQLIKQAGIDYFFTIKIGWSQYNRLPYDTFWWQGIDGTKVLTHFSTTPDMHPLVNLAPETAKFVLVALGRNAGYASTYNAWATPEQALGTWSNFQQKELHSDLLMAFGFGDGGGGPTRKMLENIREMANFPSTPRMRQEDVGDFFRKLEAEAGERAPVWNGELYLELHRGTYTTQSRNKRANRTSEFLLHDAELLATIAALHVPGYVYPAADLRRAWELVCLNQFHDIIPGSSIHDVYVESQEQYAEICAIGQQARHEALEAIAGATDADLIVVNPTGQVQSGVALWEGTLAAGKRIETSDGAPVAVQPTDGGTLLAFAQLAPLSVGALRIASGAQPAPAGGLVATTTLLENDLLRVELNAAGDITRIYDKRAAREVLPAGAIANQFQAFEDRPMNWDAWDVDIFFDDKLYLADPASDVRVVEAGPLRATIAITRTILHSSYTQRISLSVNSPQLDIDTSIDWRERHVLLKVAFPVDILSPAATYEIQWGNVQRPTHHNTSWDWARFETCAQKWVDLSEGDYGVSLLNDCKYGHDIRDNVMRISLLRSPTLPDPEADQGQHRFRYSLLPHSGPWGAETIAAAYALNDPPLVYGAASGGNGDAPGALVAADRDNIVIETVKRADDGDGIIVRFYESRRQRGGVTLTAGFDLAGAWRTNLLEDNQAQLTTDGRSVRLDVRPFEIVTLRLRPA